MKAAKVAGNEFSLLTNSALTNASAQTSDCEALNYTDIEVSQNKSGNTEEVLNNPNIPTIKQPAQDLLNNINNSPDRTKRVHLRNREQILQGHN